MTPHLPPTNVSMILGFIFHRNQLQFGILIITQAVDFLQVTLATQPMLAESSLMQDTILKQTTFFNKTAP